MLALLGVALVVLAVPQFIGTGVAPTGRHAARHLATWQAGFGCGLTIAAFRSRFGEALLALAASVAALTALATAIDVVAGHRGPVTELVHLVELGGIAVLWWLAPPHLRPRFTAGRRVRSAAADHRPAGLVLVSDLVSDRSAR